MRSVPMRRSDASQAARTLSGARPLNSGCLATLVAITVRSRAPGRAASHSPIIDSDSPPEFSGAKAL